MPLAPRGEPPTRPVPAGRSRGGTALLASVLSLALLSACTGPDGGRDGGGDGGGAVELVQPGGPGDPTRAADPGRRTTDGSWNHADVAFLQMMVPHHGQALEMARLAQRRAADPRVRSLAERIHAAQAPEILVMAAWLEEHGVEVPRVVDSPDSFDHEAHGHGGMAGMLTPTQMRRLAASRGPEFDRLFLRGMIAHHQGALAMAGTVSTAGVDLRVGELAADVSAGQSAEIGRMRRLLRSL